MEIEGDHVLSSGRKAKVARTEKLPPAVEGRAEGVSSPSAPDKVKALFTGAVMTPELAPKSTLQEEGWHIPVHTHTRGNHLPLPHEYESPNSNGGRLTNQGGTGVATTTTSGVVVATHDRTSDK